MGSQANKTGKLSGVLSLLLSLTMAVTSPFAADDTTDDDWVTSGGNTTSQSNVGIGTTSPGGKMHIFSSDAGAVNANANGDVGIFESSYSNGISILTPDGSSGNIFFTSPATTGTRGAELAFTYDSGALRLLTRKVGASISLSADNAVQNLTLSGALGSELAAFSGKVGIGTTTPSAHLEVVASGNASISAIETGGAAIEVSGRGGSGFITTKTNHPLQLGAGGSYGASINIDPSGIVTFPGVEVAYNNLYLKNNDTHLNGYMVNGTSREIIGVNANDKVEIDGQGLGVEFGGDVNFTGGLNVPSLQGPNGFTISHESSAATTSEIFIKSKANMEFTIDSDNSSTDRSFRFFNGTPTELMKIQENGRVGIGTTTPAVNLEVKGAASTQIFRVSNNTEGTLLDVFVYPDDRVAFRSTDDGNTARAISFETANVEKVRIAADGNVGIGASSPSTKLYVVGGSGANAGIRVQDVEADLTAKDGFISTGHYTNAEEPLLMMRGWAGSDDNIIQVGGGPGTHNTATSVRVFSAANTSTVTGTLITETDINGFHVLKDAIISGNVGVGTTTPTQKLDVAGNIKVQSLVTNRVSTAGVNGAVTDDNTFEAGPGYINLNRDDGASVRQIQFGKNGVLHSGIQTSTSGFSIVGSDGTPDLTIDPSGNANITGDLTVGGDFDLARSNGAIEFGDYGSLISRRVTDNNASSALQFQKARGTTSAMTPAVEGDKLGEVLFRGYNGSSWPDAATIEAYADVGFGTGNDVPGKLVFKTTPDGSATPLERMSIDSKGNVGVGTSNPLALFDVKGKVRIGPQSLDWMTGMTDADLTIVTDSPSALSLWRNDGSYINFIPGVSENKINSGKTLKLGVDDSDMLTLHESGTVEINSGMLIGNDDISTAATSNFTISSDQSGGPFIQLSNGEWKMGALGWGDPMLGFPNPTTYALEWNSGNNVMIPHGNLYVEKDLVASGGLIRQNVDNSSLVITGNNSSDETSGDSYISLIGDNATHYSGELFVGGNKVHIISPEANVSGELNVTGNANFSGDVTVGKLITNDLQFPDAPDYVFEHDYELRPLAAVEEFVKENKHLPEIPSAREMVDNGLDITAMNMGLLKKVEELTLYTIDQEKKINSYEDKLKSQEERLQRLEKLLIEKR